jgi:hypothetical protein
VTFVVAGGHAPLQQVRLDLAADALAVQGLSVPLCGLRGFVVSLVQAQSVRRAFGLFCSPVLLTLTAKRRRRRAASTGSSRSREKRTGTE